MQGSPTNSFDLNRANVKEASVVLILSYGADAVISFLFLIIYKGRTIFSQELQQKGKSRKSLIHPQLSPNLVCYFDCR